ncbi:hypothetical protein L596_000085 [Steinernema carpocapsae]|uniref:Uncharacterized protein n=1 Tax=Steinernema carpocapsae TaxID=34508 RepID=A0A4U8UHT7_STECR|nr:hypothetical protein L596_000085 [Steinernema carpocapsae]
MVGGTNGPVLEVVCSRMRYMGSQLNNGLRIVGMAAPLANATDFGHWLGCKSNVFNFAPSCRPLPLELYIQGFNLSHAPSRVAAMTKPVFSAIVRHGNKLKPKPALVFVPSLRQARITAIDLIAMGEQQKHKFLKADKEDENFQTMLGSVSDEALRGTLSYGVGYLNEGTSDKDFEIVERLFEFDAIQVVVVPSSMCYRIRMRSYLTVIMDTQFYNGSSTFTRTFPSTMSSIWWAWPTGKDERKKPNASLCARHRRRTSSRSSSTNPCQWNPT